MSNIGKAIEMAIKNIKTFFLSPMPSLFDLVVCLGIIPIGYIPKIMAGHYLVYFSIFLICLSTMFSQQRKYRSIWLSLILLWAFGSIFVHSWIVNVNSVVYKYFNFYLMSEGFIYIFFGVMLLITIIKYCKNLRILILTIPIALIPLCNVQIYCGQMSFVMAILIAFTIYTLRHGNRILTHIILATTALVTVVNIKWLIMKFACRPSIWVDLTNRIIEHPFVGTRFNKFLKPDNMEFVRSVNDLSYYWLWRHNDYLSIAAFLGIGILLLIVGYLATLIYQWRDSWKLIPLLSFVIVCFFQLTMFDAYKALLILTTLGWLYIEA